LLAFAGMLVVAVIALGSYGYVLNAIHSGSLVGDDPANRAYFAHSFGERLRTAALVPISLVIDRNGLLEGAVDEDSSWFGPLGALLILPLAVVTLFRMHRRRPTLVFALAAAVPIYVVTLAAVYEFNVWVGRFMLTPMALATPLVARIHSHRRLAALVAGVGVVTLAAVLMMNHAKPSGVGARQSVWTMTRPQAQAVQRPSMRPVLQALAACVPSNARVGYVLGEDDWDYPLYGARLTRSLVRLPRKGAYRRAAAADLEWLLVRRSLVGRLPETGWFATRFPNAGLVLLQRATGAPCARLSR